MVMRSWPTDFADTVVTCVVCQNSVDIELTTVGERDNEGHQAFACTKHLSRSERQNWFTAWANFGSERENAAVAMAMSEEYPEWKNL